MRVHKCWFSSLSGWPHLQSRHRTIGRTFSAAGMFLRFSSASFHPASYAPSRFAVGYVRYSFGSTGTVIAASRSMYSAITVTVHLRAAVGAVVRTIRQTFAAQRAQPKTPYVSVFNFSPMLHRRNINSWRCHQDSDCPIVILRCFRPSLFCVTLRKQRQFLRKRGSINVVSHFHPSPNPTASHTSGIFQPSVLLPSARSSACNVDNTVFSTSRNCCHVSISSVGKTAFPFQPSFTLLF